MAYNEIYPETQYDDAEYVSDKPQLCTGCGDETDAEEAPYQEVNDAPYCSRCIGSARAAAFTEAVDAEIVDKVGEVLTFLGEAAQAHGDDNTDPHDAYAMLDDAKARIKHSIDTENPETGWRDGCMMSRDEVSDMVNALNVVVHDMAAHIKVYANPRPYGVQNPDALAMGAMGRRLVRVARQLAALEAYRDRTRGGY